MKKSGLVAAVSMLVVPALAMAQGTPSWTVQMGGAASADVAPGDWSGTLSAILDAAGHGVGGWQGALQSSDNSVFKFGDPPVTMTAPGFAQSDIVFDQTSVGGPLGAEVSVFAISGADRPSFNQEALQFNVMSTRPLVIGEWFDFWIAESDAQPGHFLTNSTPEGAAGIPFGQPTAFRLHVIPEPASALLLIGALPFVMRRRRTA